VKLRCVTFNIWKNEGDYPRRMAAIRALLRQHAPDVVALQECFVAPALGLDSADYIADGAYYITRFAARAKPRWHDGTWIESRSDMALLTRTPPLAKKSVALVEDPRDGERGLLWADLPLAGGLRVGCTHLTHLQDPAAQAIRAEQASALIAALTAGPDRVVLMGDLNAVSTSPDLAAIFGHPNLRGVSAPVGAIDHILLFSAEPGPRIEEQRIIASPDAFNHPSDHPALHAELVLP
jgi:endonuclease/exonuclease/phosphatase family metal-dependent hydrolase